MSSPGRQRVLAVLAVLAGAGVLFAGGWLTLDAVVALRALPAHQARVQVLLERGRLEAGAAAELQAEYDRQTQATLAREARTGVLAKTLLAAAAVFLVSAKWLLTLRIPACPPPRQVVELHVRSSAAATSPPESAARPLPVVESVDLRAIDAIVARLGRQPPAAIPILQAIQAHYRYLPQAALHRVCERTEITPAQLAGVASFYPNFRHTPIGRHVVTVCHGTACHVAGAGHITDELRRQLRIAPGADTDAQHEFTVQAVPCLGCCTLAPVMQVNGVTHGHVQADGVTDLVHAAANSPATPTRHSVAPVPRAPGATEIRIGLGSCCIANGSEAVYAALQDALSAAGAQAAVKRVGCVGMCHQTPFVEVHPARGTPARYTRIRPEHARAIVRRHFKPAGLARRLTSTVAHWRDGAQRAAVAQRAIELRDPPVAAFLGPQRHIATEHCGDLDPLDLDEYLAHDGFMALRRCLEEPIAPDVLIEQIRRSGLRGRGGAGYPTWQKWSKVRAAPGELKHVICNGDEGDPGAFMDRMIMESYPYRVIEGLAIAAYATGATDGVFYIRAEYPLAVERISAAVQRCVERGLLGDDILRRGLRLHLRVVQGAGAFVCGEETALIATLEGQRGTPALRPPYPAEQGLGGRPTLVNNVETYALVPWIVRHGPEAFAALGTPTSKGTKVFALAGKVRRGGLIEVPMGITIRQIVEDIGGGVRDEETAAGPRPRAFKAVQIGGPSGGCIPATLADTPVDYEALAGLGAIMGSGGLVVLDETDCMVDMARYFLGFTQNQSCGKCTPCRIGTRRMLEILERLCAGQARPDDLATLAELARAVQQSSLCGLGKTAPNPVLTTLRYFRAEYEAHLAGRCPAGKCKALVRYTVGEACTGCTICAQHCPAGAIELRPYERHEIDADKCTRCDVCRIRCPESAIVIL